MTARDMLLANVSEREFQNFVVGVAKRNGWLVTAMHDSRRLWWGVDAGIPDLLMVRSDRVLFMELKRKQGRVSPDQRKWLDALNAANVEAYVLYPDQDDDVRRILQ